MNLQRLVFFILMICLITLPYWGVMSSSYMTVPPIEKDPRPSYTIEPHAPDQAFLQHEYKTYPGPIEGIISPSHTWTGFFRQNGRDINIDFGKLQRISGLSLEFKQEVEKGILLPDFLEAFISIDGRKWNRLGRVDVLPPPHEESIQAKTLSIVFSPMMTRYVKLSFPVEQWVFARRLSFQQEVQTSPLSPIILSHFDPANKADLNFLNIEDIHDIALIYTGDHGPAGIWRKEEFLPMLSYLHPEGHFQDRMFDTFLFLPYPTLTRNWRNWKDYLEDLFSPGQQLHALNEASEKLHQRTKIILTMAYPVPDHSTLDQLSPSQSIFAFPFINEEKGDIWKIKQSAMEAYFEQVWDKWINAQFSHLDLVGFYWLPETVDQTIPHEVDLVQTAAHILQQKKLKFYWIPYFGSSGYHQWKTFGFDYVFLQPNYYATLTPAEDRMENTARIAKEQHLGMELELDERVLSNRYYYDLFYKQLNQAKDLGLDQAVTNAYYIGGRKVLVQAAFSQVPQARQIYDDLFKWMKGTYQKQNK